MAGQEALLALVALTAGAGFARKAEKKRLANKRPLESTPLPDIPEIIEALKEAPDIAGDLKEDSPNLETDDLLETLKPIEQQNIPKLAEPLPILPITPLPKLEEKIYVLTDEEKKKFPQFGKLTSGDFTWSEKIKDENNYPKMIYFGGAVASSTFSIKRSQTSYDKTLVEIKKLETEGLKPKLTQATKDWANEVMALINANLNTPENLFKQQRSYQPSQHPPAYRKDRWGEIYLEITADQKRMKTTSSGVYEAWLAKLTIISSARNEIYSEASKIKYSDKPKYDALMIEYNKLDGDYKKYKIDNPSPSKEARLTPKYNAWNKLMLEARTKYLVNTRDIDSWKKWYKDNPTPYTLSNDYTDEGYQYQRTIQQLMMKFELGNYTPWHDAYDGTDTQAKSAISQAKSGISSGLRRLKENMALYSGEISAASVIDELMDKAANYKKAMDFFALTADFGNNLIKEYFPNQQRYIKILKGPYDPEALRELKLEIEESEKLFFENELQVKLEKGRPAYKLSAGFHHIKVDLLNSIIAHVNKFKYTENGKYKRSELIKQGFKDWEEIPPKFIQWANLGILKDHEALAVESITEMMKMLMFWADPREHYDFYVAIKPFMDEFEILYDKAVRDNPEKKITKYERYYSGREALLKVTASIASTQRRFTTSIFAQGASVFPESYFTYMGKSSTGMSMSGEPPLKTKNKMREILGAKEEEFGETFPDYPADFESLSHKAFYLNSIKDEKLKLAKYWIERKKKVEKTLRMKKIELAENSEPYEDVEFPEINQLKVIKEVAPKTGIVSYIHQAEKFFYTKETISENENSHAKLLDHIKKISSTTKTKEGLIYKEQVLYMDNALIPYLEKSLAEKKKVYKFILGMGMEFQKKKELSIALNNLETALVEKRYLGAGKKTWRGFDYSSVFVPAGHFMFPRPEGEQNNPSLNYHIVLKNVDLDKFIKSSDNPIGEKMTRLLMAPIQDHPMGTKAYMATYIALAGKGLKVADSLRRRREPFASDPEFAFYNLLFHFLLKKIRSRYDIRAMLEVTPYGKTWKVGKWATNGSGAFLETKTADIERRLTIMDSFFTNSNYNSDWVWTKLFSIRTHETIRQSDFADLNIFSAKELDILKYSFCAFPSLEFVMNYANTKDMMPIKALKEIDKFAATYRNFVQARVPFNRSLDHENWTSINPTFNKHMSEYNRMKYLIIKNEKEVIEDVFNDLTSYIGHWEKTGNDKDWKGNYPHLFKVNAPKHSDVVTGIVAGLDEYESDPIDEYYNDDLDEYYNDDGTMGGLFDFVKKAIEVVKSPAEKLYDKAKSAVDSVGNIANKVVSPISGIAKEILTDIEESKLKQLLNETYDSTIKKHIMTRLGNAMSKIEQAALRPAAKALKKGMYEVIPKSAFQSFKNLTKVPGHLIKNKGKLSKDDIRGIMTDMLRVGTGASVMSRLSMKGSGKMVNHLTKHTEFFEKLDLYSGGLLSSGANLSTMPEEIAEGREIDRGYVLHRSIDALKVGVTVASFGAGSALVAGVALGTQVGTNAILGETNWVKDSGMRSAISVVAAAGAAYATAGASTTQSAATIATTEGGKVAAGAAASSATSVATKKAVEITFTQALKTAAVAEAKTQLSRVAAREILSEAGMDDSELAVLIVGIGVVAAVAVIGTNTTYSNEVIERTKMAAITYAEKKADVQLKKIDPNLSVKMIKSAYNLANQDLQTIVKEKSARLEQYVKSGELLKDAQKEVERAAKREVKRKFETELAHLEDKFLDWLMDKFGLQHDYDQFITPELMLEYVDITIKVEELRTDYEIITRRKIVQARKKKWMIGAGVIAALAATTFVVMDD